MKSTLLCVFVAWLYLAVMAVEAKAAANPQSSFWYKQHTHPKNAGAPRSRGDFSDAVDENPDSDTISFTCPHAGSFQSNCTHYIYCNEALEAQLIACPACETDLFSCPDGRFHFSEELGECTWPENAKCGTHPTTTTTPIPTIPTPGTECDPLCYQYGECFCYYVCLNDTTSSEGGRWEKFYCDYDGDTKLYWNPDFGPHGGTCTYWENLSPAMQKYYQNLPEEDCPTPELPCHWRKHERCDNWYYYLAPGQKNQQFEQLVKCPKSAEGEPLYWGQKDLSCVLKCPKNGKCYAC